MKIGVKTVVEISIWQKFCEENFLLHIRLSTWLPNFLQHGNIQTELIYYQVVSIVLEALEAEPLISPVLTEVAVHRVVLKT